MSQTDCSIVFDGTLVEGAAREEVVQRLAALFKQPVEKVESLMSGKPVVIKRHVSRDVADRYLRALRRAGAVCRILDGGRRHAPGAESPQQRTQRAKAGQPTPRTASDRPQDAAGAARSDASPGARPRPRAAGDEKPAAAAAAADPAQAQSLFEGTVAPTKLEWGYRLGLAAVAVAMVALLGVYVAMTAGAGWFVYWWARNGMAVLPDGWFAIVLVALYLLPLVVGAVLTLFMVKPFFVGSAVERLPLTLSRKQDALFFAFIHQLCDATGAPRPKVIQVDCMVNAAASFHRGGAGLAANELALTVGLPLIAGLTTRQLAGVLAHEFGHFAQNAGMRATYAIRTIMFWFYRSVFWRDIWDARLEYYATSTNSFWITLTLQCSRGAVWVVRGIMFGLLHAGELVSRYMLRQMEFDADRYEAQVAGSEQFRDTSVRLRLLAFAHNAVCNDLGRLWESRRLVDDLPTMTVEKAAELQPEFDKLVDQMLAVEQTEIFDSHPADNERIASAQRLNAPGIFTLDRPAKVLLERFEELSKDATKRFYRAELGIKLSDDALVGTDQMKEQMEQAQAQDDALSTYCRDLFQEHRFLKPEDPARYGELAGDEAKARLESCVGELRANGPEIFELVSQHTLTDEYTTRAYVTHVLTYERLDPSLVPPLDPEKGNFETSIDRLAQIERKLGKFDEVLSQRLAIGLAGAIARGEPAGCATEIERLLAAQSGLARIQEDADGAHRDIALIRHMLYLADATRDPETGECVITEQSFSQSMTGVGERHARIQGILKGIAFPFERAGPKISVLDHLHEEAPQPSSEYAGELLDYLEGLIHAAYRFQIRVMGRLAKIAGDHEASLGVAPIKIQIAAAPEA